MSVVLLAAAGLGVLLVGGPNGPADDPGGVGRDARSRDGVGPVARHETGLLGARSPGAGRACTSARCRATRDLRRLRKRLLAQGAVAGEAIVDFDSPDAMRAFLDRARRHGVRILSSNAGLSTVRVALDSRGRLRRALIDSGGTYAGLDANFWVTLPADPEFKPADPAAREGGHVPFAGNHFLDAIGAGGDRAGWGQGVKVAVVDTGVGPHPTFAEGQVTHVDLVGDGQPFHPHGTAMAGLIAGQTASAPGVAPDAQILDVRVLDASGVGTTYLVSEGITQAADQGAQVISLSLGSDGDSAMLREAVAYAGDRGAVLVGAAGNDGRSDGLHFPAAIDAVISVGGVDANGQLAWFTNSGPGLDVLAPAVGITSATSAGDVVLGNGTSHATAITAGVVAYGLGNRLTAANGAERWLADNASPLDPRPGLGDLGTVRVPEARRRAR